jgi:hypothetical protein
VTEEDRNVIDINNRENVDNFFLKTNIIDKDNNINDFDEDEFTRRIQLNSYDHGEKFREPETKDKDKIYENDINRAIELSLYKHKDKTSEDDNNSNNNTFYCNSSSSSISFEDYSRLIIPEDSLFHPLLIFCEELKKNTEVYVY